MTGQEVKNWCRVTLADYKIPDWVRFLDSFPLRALGRSGVSSWPALFRRSSRVDAPDGSLTQHARGDPHGGASGMVRRA